MGGAEKFSFHPANMLPGHPSKAATKKNNPSPSLDKYILKSEKLLSLPLPPLPLLILMAMRALVKRLSVLGGLGGFYTASPLMRKLFSSVMIMRRGRRLKNCQEVSWRK